MKLDLDNTQHMFVFPFLEDFGTQQNPAPRSNRTTTERLPEKQSCSFMVTVCGGHMMNIYCTEFYTSVKGTDSLKRGRRCVLGHAL